MPSHTEMNMKRDYCIIFKASLYKIKWSFGTCHQNLGNESSPKDNFIDESFLKSINCSWKPKGNPASKSATFVLNRFFFHVQKLMFSRLYFLNFFLGVWRSSKITNKTEVIKSGSGLRSSMDLFKIGRKANSLFSTLTYHNSDFSLEVRTLSEKSITVWHSLCIDLFNVFSAAIISHK